MLNNKKTRTFIASLVLSSAALASGTAFAGSNKGDVQAGIEAGWVVAWGDELDHADMLLCTAELVAIGPGALADCAADAILASVEDLGWDLVIKVCANLGRTFSTGELEVQADLATYNNWHEECPPWPFECFDFPEPNTYQPYIRWRSI